MYTYIYIYTYIYDVFLDGCVAWNKNRCELENLRPVSPGSDARLREPHCTSERTQRSQMPVSLCRVTCELQGGGRNPNVACL